MVLSQAHLGLVLKNIFPGEKIVTNVREGNLLINPATGSFLELDFWIPKYKLAFEFQDAYHYTTTWYSHVPLATVQQNDNIKRDMVRNLGEILIYVPCWWDGSKESLIGSIRFHRPDLFSNTKKRDPIPLNIPFDYFKQNEVEGIGELMLATFPQSRQLRNRVLTSHTWWMGEKYDGIRACWNAGKQLLYTRGGIQLSFADKIINSFGKSFIDGEIWFGRGCFPDSQGTMVTPNDVDYSQLRVIGFDSPFPSREELEERYTRLLYTIPSTHPFIIIAARNKCMHRLHLNTSLQKMIKDGGEGIILHKSKSFYESGRSASVFKLKASRGDYEALVLSSESKWIMLQLPDGMIFSLPSITHLLVKQGDIVTISYQNHSRRETPVNPKILRIRRDVSWEYVLRDFYSTSGHISGEKQVVGFTTKPQGYWKSDKGKLRTILEEYAKNNSFDPLDCNKWYSVDSKMISGLNSSSLSPFNGSFIKALISCFTEVHFDQEKFSSPSKQYWQREQNRRNVFDRFATDNGFDPLVANNWYSVNVDSVRDTKGAETVLRMYSGSMPRALKHLYPDIGLQLSFFRDQELSSTYWKDTKNRMAFLEPKQTSGLRLRIKSNI